MTLSPGSGTSTTSTLESDFVGDLEVAEREVSEQRHRLHGVIDALHEELAARYRSGAELD